MNQKEIEIEIYNFLEKKDCFDSFNRCCIIAGPWGVGKTYLINNIIQRSQGIYNFVNVSLFGISDVNDLKMRILKEMCKPAKRFANVMKVLLSSVSFQFGISNFASVSIDLGKVSDAFNDKRVHKLNFSKKTFVVVLDDIERKDNKLSIVEVLGTVDELLKNKNIKVILVTNFDKLTFNNECEAFKDFKERIANHTYELNDVEEIIESILNTKNNYSLGTNLRTIYQFKEMLAF